MQKNQPANVEKIVRLKSFALRRKWSLLFALLLLTIAVGSLLYVFVLRNNEVWPEEEFIINEEPVDAPAPDPETVEASRNTRQIAGVVTSIQQDSIEVRLEAGEVQPFKITDKTIYEEMPSYTSGEIDKITVGGDVVVIYDQRDNQAYSIAYEVDND